MRKFKDTHRKKRKYTKKQQNTPAYSVNKTWYINLLPLLVIALALVSLGIVAHNFSGNTFTFDHSIKLPRFIFPDVISLMQITWMNIIAIITSLQQISVQVGQWFGSLIQLLDLKPTITFLTNGIQQIYKIMLYSCVQAIRFEFNALWMYVAISSTLYLTFLQIFIFLSEVIYYFLIQSYNVVVPTIFSILSFLLILSQIVAVKIVIATHATLYFLGTPFRYLEAFWVIIKPYVDFFMEHVRMTFFDFQHGARSLESLTSLKP